MLRNSKTIIVSILVLSGLTNCNKPADVQWVSSSPEQFWQQKEYIFEQKEEAKIINLKTDDELQTINGFGACFNELGWEALQTVDQEKQQEILKSLFDSVEGCNFTIGRMPMGASDFGVSWYSFNPVAGDFAMENFTIERDKKRMIPYIKSAMGYQPNLRIWGSPWCPPEWMKTNNHYSCRPDTVNDLTPEGQGQEGVTQFIMEEEYLDAYALYFQKYVEEYRNQGIDVYAVHVQNEPNSCQNFPSCIWTASDLNTFIGSYLGPLFSEKLPEIEIWYGTIERPFIENIDTVLMDPVTSEFVDGVGFQWAGKGAIPKVDEKYPDMDLMQTESECGNGSNDWDAAEYTYSLIKHYLENGTNVYMYWNMILDETGKSQWGWKQNSLITIDTETGDVDWNPEYYLMKHFGSNVMPGAKMIKTDGAYKDVLAFKNPDGAVVVFIANTSEEVQDIELLLDDDASPITASIDANSFNTLKIKP